VLEPQDRAMIQGFLINKFRGDPELFRTGRAEITRRTDWCDLGMAPWMAAARRLPAEDAVVLQTPGSGRPDARVKIVVPLLPSIANFDEFDALRSEPAVDFAFLPPGSVLPGDVDLVVLAGAKATLSDLAALRAQGWDTDIAAHVRRGGRVLGVCGGYQMLGRRIADPLGLEGAPAQALGLGLLDVETVLAPRKTLRRVEGRLAGSGAAFGGYEIHLGETSGPATMRPYLVMTDGRRDGAVSKDGRVAGGYVHGLFDRGEARAALLSELGAASHLRDRTADIDADLDTVAATLDRHLDIDALARIAGL
jgi:adenosylcobyric acid synthase